MRKSVRSSRCKKFSLINHTYRAGRVSLWRHHFTVEPSVYRFNPLLICHDNLMRFMNVHSAISQPRLVHHVKTEVLMLPIHGHPRENEKRKSLRIPQAADIVVENSGTGNCNPGRMVNCSASGMCFEAHVPFAVGSEVLVCFRKSPYSSMPDVYRARVVWAREGRANGDTLEHIVGVRYC